VDDPVRHDATLNRQVRAGDLQDQAASTYRLAAAAVGEGSFEEAERLGRFALEEAREGRELYPMFVQRAREFLLREGMRPERLSAEEQRLLEKLRLPGGEAFDLERGWAAFEEAIEVFAVACSGGHADAALQHLEEARRIWRRTHDRACDQVCGLLDLASRSLGEDRIGELWDHMMADLYPSRDRYGVDVRPWSRSVEALVLDAATSLRGHLSGPGRTGDVEVEEQEDRWVLRFDPCGSGGRTYRPDHEEGTPARMEPPYDFAVTTREHDWAWNMKGVCLYCVHCCQLQERVPIERLGYPLRVVDPPTWHRGEVGGKCTWSIYKDPALVPEEAYRRVGARKPAAPSRDP
jgi:hypothetical protein